MSKHQLKCSCVYCGTETTVQSLKAHVNKCTSMPSNECEYCYTPTDNARFCSRSCRAVVVNQQRTTKLSKPRRLTNEEKCIQRFKAGLVTNRNTLRKLLKRFNGYRCSYCHLSKWNSEDITLIVDHIDGDASNNYPSNLRLLCPNCNSQTSTFGARNKGNGRKSRGLPLN